MTIISIDLETLATAPSAVIAAIGVSVMSDDGNFVDGFKTKVDLNQPGRSVSSSTMAFWLEQDYKAQALTFAVTASESDMLPSLHIALSNMCVFIHSHINASSIVWGNPATFDISKLEHAMEIEKLQFPWEFWQLGDTKTLKLVSSGQWRNIEFIGARHCCLDDAVHQAKCISLMLGEHNK